MARKRNLIAVLAVAALIPGLAAAAGSDTPPAAPAPLSPAVVEIGSAYVAKQLCSCLFVAGRTEASCKPEFKPQIDMAQVSVDRSRLPDRASVDVTLLTTTAHAAYSRRYGCTLSR